jgi:type II secretory pathway pseudopilin PulG
MKRFAFTMLELVFVIIVIGILAVLAIPNFGRQPAQEAAMQIASHIRYTQHLAMIDDKYDSNDSTWWQMRWQIHFEDGANATEKIYMIYYNKDKDANEDDNELAKDPQTGKLMRGADNDVALDPSKYMDNLMLSKRFGITSVTFSPSCHNGASPVTSNRLGFDNMGRPYFNTANATAYSDLLISDCNITLAHPDGNVILTVRPETGYVCVVDTLTGACQGTN